MKLLFLLLIPFSLYAPYDPNPGQKPKTYGNFFIKWDPKTESFVRIRVSSCIVETPFYRPERSKREEPQNVVCGALNIAEMQ
jgi:hypothetical protein